MPRDRGSSRMKLVTPLPMVTTFTVIAVFLSCITLLIARLLQPPGPPGRGPSFWAPHAAFYPRGRRDASRFSDCHQREGLQVVENLPRHPLPGGELLHLARQQAGHGEAGVDDCARSAGEGHRLAVVVQALLVGADIIRG